MNVYVVTTPGEDGYYVEAVYTDESIARKHAEALDDGLWDKWILDEHAEDVARGLFRWEVYVVPTEEVRTYFQGFANGDETGRVSDKRAQGYQVAPTKEEAIRLFSERVAEFRRANFPKMADAPMQALNDAPPPSQPEIGEDNQCQGHP